MWLLNLLDKRKDNAAIIWKNRMTHQVVDKQSTLLQKGLKLNYSLVPCLCTSVPQTPPLCNTAGTTFGSHLLGFLPPVDSNPWPSRLKESVLCSLLQSHRRGLASYFTGILVNLISHLRSQSLGCELKHCRHTAFPWMAQWFPALWERCLAHCSPAQLSSRRASTAPGKAWAGGLMEKRRKRNNIPGIHANFEGNNFSRLFPIQGNVDASKPPWTSMCLKC